MGLYLGLGYGESIGAISFVIQGQGHILGQGHRSFQAIWYLNAFKTHLLELSYMMYLLKAGNVMNDT